jgi:hypothetical protein
MSLHTRISFLKSGVRILGYILGGLTFRHGPLPAAFFVLVLSEVIGIFEELGEK